MKHAEVICTEVLKIIDDAEQKLPKYDDYHENGHEYLDKRETGRFHMVRDVRNQVFNEIRLAIANFIKNGGKNGR